MAKKQIKTEDVKYFCRDCVYATDYHDKNHKGEYFMCKCKFQKRSMFLNRDNCNNFKKKS